jgi:hypothetical protein
MNRTDGFYGIAPRVLEIFRHRLNQTLASAFMLLVAFAGVVLTAQLAAACGENSGANGFSIACNYYDDPDECGQGVACQYETCSCSGNQQNIDFCIALMFNCSPMYSGCNSFCG